MNQTTSKIKIKIENTVLACMAETFSATCLNGTHVMGKDCLRTQSKLVHKPNNILSGTSGEGERGCQGGQCVKRDEEATSSSMYSLLCGVDRHSVSYLSSGDPGILNCVFLEKYTIKDSMEDCREVSHFILPLIYVYSRLKLPCSTTQDAPRSMT
jgi:hypothetical protein